MIVAVTGGRDYPWTDEDTDLFESLVRFLDVKEIWHGGAVGVDAAVHMHARRLRLSVRVFQPELGLSPEELPRALLSRSARMIEALDHAIHHDGHRGAVWAWPGNDGTDFTVGQALRRRLHTLDLRGRSPR